MIRKPFLIPRKEHDDNDNDKEEAPAEKPHFLNSFSILITSSIKEARSSETRIFPLHHSLLQKPTFQVKGYEGYVNNMEAGRRKFI
jgi:hypothetical protein